MYTVTIQEITINRMDYYEQFGHEQNNDLALMLATGEEELRTYKK